ncbi:MAG: LysR family transcriptional regulator [Clostridiales bacterium]|nr:LysR family transcriptional regulator [Clostridiales bacterium]
MSNESRLHPRIAVRIFAGADKAFGPGVMHLLHNVERLSSLRSAAADMGMAYSKAWRIVKECEAALGFSLLSSTTGGRHGGGGTLTNEAKALLARYEAYTAALQEASERLFGEHFDGFMEEVQTKREAEQQNI